MSSLLTLPFNEIKTGYTILPSHPHTQHCDCTVAKSTVHVEPLGDYMCLMRFPHWKRPRMLVLFPGHPQCMGSSHFAYFHFAYSHFAYEEQTCVISPT